jgi:hypothetical protein
VVLPFLFILLKIGFYLNLRLLAKANKRKGTGITGMISTVGQIQQNSRQFA